MWSFIYYTIQRWRWQNNIDGNEYDECDYDDNDCNDGKMEGGLWLWLGKIDDSDRNNWNYYEDNDEDDDDLVYNDVGQEIFC